LNQQKKTRGPGRPKLPEGHAKVQIVPVRFKPEDLKRIAAAAKAKNQTVSGWIRSTLNATIGQD
jgi:predicted HicB family RNase H-like nuclease